MEIIEYAQELQKHLPSLDGKSAVDMAMYLLDWEKFNGVRIFSPHN